jgi:hypothetical protein
VISVSVLRTTITVTVTVSPANLRPGYYAVSGVILIRSPYDAFIFIGRG